MPLRRAVPPPPYAKIKTGQYTGDGKATQAITGVGFQPKVVMIWWQQTAASNPNFFTRTDQDGTKTLYCIAGGVNEAWQYEDDYIISLDADGFTIGDGTGGTAGNFLNSSGRAYTWIAQG